MTRFESLRAACEEKPHGTRARYISGCGCLRCRAANSRYESERLKARAQGDWNGVVPIDKARAHILGLSAAGVGYKSVATAADVSKTICFQVLRGTRKHIRARTERKILAVDQTAIADGQKIDARPTWLLINSLLSRGFTKIQISEWLGTKNALQIGRRQITAHKAMKVERMVLLLEAGKLRRTR